MSFPIVSYEGVDQVIYEADGLIAQLNGDLIDITTEQAALGNTVQSAATRAACEPTRRHIAELEAERSRLSHYRTRMEARLTAWANGINVDTQPEMPGVETFLDDIRERNTKRTDEELEATMARFDVQDGTKGKRK